MPWLMAAHIGSLALWCAGLFLLPGMFAAASKTRPHSSGCAR